MRLPNDYEERPGITPTLISAIVAVTLFVGAILVVVLLMNDQGERPHTNVVQQPSSVVTDDTLMSNDSDMNGDQVLPNSGLRPEDLDFWDKYPKDTSEESLREESRPSENRDSNKATESSAPSDPSTDGKHTLVQHADGKEEWVLISPYLPKNDYDFTKLVCQSDLMKYYVDGKLVSYVGVDISKYQDYVDFVKLRRAGIDFVMIRVGARGYGTGQLVLDDYFYDNIKRASDAGLRIGLYFSSQAITVEEAVEEANMVLDNIGDYVIDYPIAFNMGFVANDTARIDVLSKAEKTAIAKAFLDTVQEAGYIGILYGDKEWLIKEIDMSKLTAYDVWLSQIADIPDYPYRFSIWQYKDTAIIDGIAGYASLNVSFIDYSEK